MGNKDYPWEVHMELVIQCYSYGISCGFSCGFHGTHGNHVDIHIYHSSRQTDKHRITWQKTNPDHDRFEVFLS